jgi:hypothetical protein
MDEGYVPQCQLRGVVETYIFSTILLQTAVKEDYVYRKHILQDHALFDLNDQSAVSLEGQVFVLLMACPLLLHMCKHAW